MMKSVLVLVFALCTLACAFPRAVQEDSNEDVSSDTEYVRVPVMRSHRPSFGFGPASDLAPPPLDQNSFLFRISPWGRPAATPGDQEQVDDFMTQMQAMLTEMRRQITEMLHHSHAAGGLPDDENNTGVGTRIGEGELPQNKSTSTTKVIDGHVVTVNETTFSSGDDNIGAVFRIKVVEVVPSETPGSEGGVEVEGSSTESKSEPTTSKSELDEDKHEETNEIPSQKVYNEWDAEIDPSFNEIDQQEDFSAESWTPNKKENYYDLREDTKVNNYLSDQIQSQGLVMIEPDAEVFDSDLNSYYHYESMPQRLQRFP